MVIETTTEGQDDRGGSRRPCEVAPEGMARPLPALWEVYEIARLIGWSRRRMQRLLARELGIASKVGGRWVVSTADLRDRFPQAHRELVRRRDETTTEGQDDHEMG